MLRQERPRAVGKPVNQRAITFNGNLPIILVERAPVPVPEQPGVSLLRVAPTWLPYFRKKSKIRRTHAQSELGLNTPLMAGAFA